ncbi:hypothetical protein LJR220_003354 [Bradyrhizobium sp. LjRoot220]|uniref:hypothetical protein n=1 Tax=Bradyrhizobium sp. LjRoot220 TaxID=3342284 RepID=UPI003ECDDDD1
MKAVIALLAMAGFAQHAWAADNFSIMSTGNNGTYEVFFRTNRKTGETVRCAKGADGKGKCKIILRAIDGAGRDDRFELQHLFKNDGTVILPAMVVDKETAKTWFCPGNGAQCTPYDFDW